MKKKSKPLPLFEHPVLARNDDPDTSHDAAESMRDHVVKQDFVILDCMNSGGFALACEQIADRSRGRLNQIQVNRRMSTLERLGLVVKTEFKHVNRSRREAYKYRLPREERLEF